MKISIETKRNKRAFHAFYAFLFLILACFHEKGFSASTIKVSAITDGHEAVSQKSLKVKKGKKATFTIKAKKGYTFSKLVAGNCPAGKWKSNKYITGTITKSCKVFFSAGRKGGRFVLVTPSGDNNLTITPNHSEKIISGSLAQLKVTPNNPAEPVSRSVGGTCPKGVWLDTVYYKLGPINKNCSVTFTAPSQGGGGGGNIVGPKYGWLDPSENVYIADSFNHVIRKVDFATQIISTVAGTGAVGYSGDGGPATNATLNLPGGVALDSSGNFYIADQENCAIRKVDTDGIISTFAGGSCGYSGDGGPATSAQLSNQIVNIVTDYNNNLYIPDASNSVVRKVDATTGIISTVAGNGNVGYSGDGGQATNATLNTPLGLVVDDSTGNIFIADRENHVVRKVDVSTGIISTYAGVPVLTTLSGDGGAATEATLSSPHALAFDSSNNLYIAEDSQNTVRKVDTSTGIITTVIGTWSMPATFGYTGDNGPATSATLYSVLAFSIAASGKMYVCDRNNGVIRMVDPTTGIITTIVGDQSLVGGYSGDGGPATAAALNNPFF